MRWWKQRRRVHPDPSAIKARIDAERDLAERRADTKRVHAMLEEWRDTRRRNHFGEALKESFRGGHA